MIRSVSRVTAVRANASSVSPVLLLEILSWELSFVNQSSGDFELGVVFCESVLWRF